MSKMKAAVRCKAIDLAGLAVQEKHGKRQDSLSKMRRVRDLPPITKYGGEGLNLRALYDKHIEGARMNSALKKCVLHFIVRFPPELLESEGAGRFSGSKENRQIEMCKQAVLFVQRTHGGNAVFDFRMDRDETGETIVDVFAAPKYEKRTKRTKPDAVGDIWMSPTKFGKELAEKHAEEIHRRHPKAKGKLTKPRHVGIALQSEFADFFKEINGIELAPKVEKKTARKDRIEKEAHDELEKKRREIEAAAAEKEQELAKRERKIADAKRDVEKREIAVTDAFEHLEYERQILKDEKSGFEKIKERVMGIVKTFGKMFGLPLPESIAEAVDALESEIQRQEFEFRDPFAAAEPDDFSPGF